MGLTFLLTIIMMVLLWLMIWSATVTLPYWNDVFKLWKCLHLRRFACYAAR